MTAVTPFGLTAVVLGHYRLEVAVRRRIIARFPWAHGETVADSLVMIGFFDQRLSEGDGPLPKRWSPMVPRGVSAPSRWHL